jgi:hypothetical protein
MAAAGHPDGIKGLDFMVREVAIFKLWSQAIQGEDWPRNGSRSARRRPAILKPGRWRAASRVCSARLKIEALEVSAFDRAGLGETVERPDASRSRPQPLFVGSPRVELDFFRSLLGCEFAAKCSHFRRALVREIRTPRSVGTGGG